MAGQMVHVEIPAGDTAKAREFWGSLFGWEFQAFEGSPSEYLMTRLSDTTGGAIYQAEGSERGPRVYFDVDDINAGAARVKELGGRGRRPDARARHGLVHDLQGRRGKRLRPLAERPVGPGSRAVRLEQRPGAAAGLHSFAVAYRAGSASKRLRQPAEQK